MKLNQYSLNIITSNIKARILIEQELFDGTFREQQFFETAGEYSESAASTGKGRPSVVLLDLSADFTDTESLFRGEEDFVFLFSAAEIDEQDLELHEADGAFRLPFTSSEFQRKVQEAFALRGCRDEELILFIDDSQLMHKMVDSILSPHDFRIEHADAGEEGLRLASELLPDLIITDIQMPGMDGYEVCRSIKEDERLCGIPVIIQSSLTDGTNIDRGFEAGADDYITKPLNAADLVGRVNSFLRTVPKSRETILVADNSRLISNMVETGLRKQGFNCRTASNGPAILEAAETGDIDMFIISQVLAEMDGREVVRSLRSRPGSKSSPVIMLSSRDSKLELLKNRSAGVSEFISKPFSVERMLVTVERLLAESRFIKEREAMSLYLSDAAIDHAGKIAKSRSPLTMRAKEEFRTILFTDIVGFTPICEQLSPEKVISLLNSYFDLMVDIIRENGGEIDKFIGDAVMAVFAGRENGAYLAVKSGLEMISALESFNETAEHRIDIRVGINSGSVVLGDLGSRYFRRDYTLIGDSVNVAQRLESAAPAGRILVSEAAWMLVKDSFTAEQMDPVQLKGKQDKVVTYLITGQKG